MRIVDGDPILRPVKVSFPRPCVGERIGTDRRAEPSTSDLHDR